MKKHPMDGDLALYAGGELPLARRLLAAWHLRRCGRCRHAVARIQEARAALRAAADLPPGVDWPTLEAEMKANIRLGLAAGELVSRPAVRPRLRTFDWKAAAVVAASLVLVTAAGWLLQRAGRTAAPAASAEILLHPSKEGLSVRWGQSGSAVFGLGQAPVAAAVSWDGSARAPFVDEDTGQVTIYDVAAQ